MALLGEEFLAPTKIYVKTALQALKRGKVKAFAHITGGGLTENIPRVLSSKLAVELDAKLWTIPSLYGWLAVQGGINEHELLRTFNCGLGGIVIVENEAENDVLKALEADSAVVVGKVVNRTKGW